MASGRTVARRAAYEVATTLSRYPAVASRAARMWNIGTPVDDGTDVVIEGFPRSGNTAVFAAFSVAQPSEIRIAHHTHTPANAIAGVRRGLPVLVLIRAPDDPGVDEDGPADEFAEQIGTPKAQAGGWRGFLSRWGSN